MTTSAVVLIELRKDLWATTPPYAFLLCFHCHSAVMLHRRPIGKLVRIISAPPHMNVSYAADVLPYVLAPQAIDTDNDNVVYPHRYRSLV